MTKLAGEKIVAPALRGRSPRRSSAETRRAELWTGAAELGERTHAHRRPGEQEFMPLLEIESRSYSLTYSSRTTHRVRACSSLPRNSRSWCTRRHSVCLRERRRGTESAPRPRRLKLIGRDPHRRERPRGAERSEITPLVTLRTKHVHVVGASGTGQVNAPREPDPRRTSRTVTALRCLEPHGDLDRRGARADSSEDAEPMSSSSTRRAQTSPVGWNMLAAHSDAEKEILASDLVCGLPAALDLLGRPDDGGSRQCHPRVPGVRSRRDAPRSAALPR